MRRLADGNHQHAIVGIEVVQILANSKHAFVTIHMSLKCAVDAGFRQRMLKQVARDNAHVESKLLAIGGRRRHVQGL